MFTQRVHARENRQFAGTKENIISTRNVANAFLMTDKMSGTRARTFSFFAAPPDSHTRNEAMPITQDNKKIFVKTF